MRALLFCIVGFGSIYIYYRVYLGGNMKKGGLARHFKCVYFWLIVTNFLLWSYNMFDRVNMNMIVNEDLYSLRTLENKMFFVEQYLKERGVKIN